ncbi:MAG TPA: DUF2012 domain-containing protein [Acidobacteriota bacterium]|nr:DUF2012 domain-containing protein [Acidobacteriota bacterium]
MSRLNAAILILLGILVIPCIALAQALTIDGRIRTEDGRAPDHMRVYLLDNMYTEKQVQYVASDGHFVFRTATGENYYVKVDAGEMDYEPQTVRVQTGLNPYNARAREVVNVNIVLKLRDVVKRERAGPIPGSGGVTFAQPAVPASAREAYDKASKSLAKDDSKGAMVLLKRALEIFPDYFDALEALGAEYVKQRSYGEAVPLLRHALQVNDLGWRSHYALGVALVESQQRAEGLSELRRSIDLNPESPNGHMRLGMELAKDPQAQTEAIKELEKVTAIAGKSIPDAYFDLASLYSKLKKYKEAADALEGYLAAQSKVDDAQRAQYQKAIQQLREKAAKPPQN